MLKSGPCRRINLKPPLSWHFVYINLSQLPHFTFSVCHRAQTLLYTCCSEHSVRLFHLHLRCKSRGVRVESDNVKFSSKSFSE